MGLTREDVIKAFPTMHGICLDRDDILDLVDRAEKAEREAACLLAARVTWPDHVLAAVARGDVEACAADAKARHMNWEDLHRQVKSLVSEAEVLQARLNGADQRANAYQRELSEARAQRDAEAFAADKHLGETAAARAALATVLARVTTLEVELADEKALRKEAQKLADGRGIIIDSHEAARSAARVTGINTGVAVASESLAEKVLDAIGLPYDFAHAEGAVVAVQQLQADRAQLEAQLSEATTRTERLAADVVGLREALTEVRAWRRSAVGLEPRPTIDANSLGARIEAAIAVPTNADAVLSARDAKTREEAVELYRRRRVMHRDTERGREVVTFDEPEAWLAERDAKLRATLEAEATVAYERLESERDEAEADAEAWSETASMTGTKLDAVLARVGVLREALRLSRSALASHCKRPSGKESACMCCAERWRGIESVARLDAATANPDAAAVARDERLKAEARNAALEEAARLIEPSTSLERPDTTMYSNHDDAERDFAAWSEQETLKALADRVRAVAKPSEAKTPKGGG